MSSPANWRAEVRWAHSGWTDQRVNVTLALSRPRWLMEHIEQRTTTYPEHEYQDADVFKQMFGEVTSDPVELAWMLERAWGWEREAKWTLTKMTGSEVFHKVALTNETLATQFLRDRIAEAQRVPELYDIVSWIFKLPFGSVQDDVAEEALLRAHSLGATTEEWKRLASRVSSSVTNGRQFKEGPGPFPGDALLQRLAQKHLNAAQERINQGDLSADFLETFWGKVFDQVNQTIKRTISNERRWEKLE